MPYDIRTPFGCLSFGHRDASDQKFKRKEGKAVNQLRKAMDVAVSNSVQWFWAQLPRSLPIRTVMPADAQAAANVSVEVTCIGNGEFSWATGKMFSWEIDRMLFEGKMLSWTHWWWKLYAHVWVYCSLDFPLCCIHLLTCISINTQFRLKLEKGKEGNWWCSTFICFSPIN